MTSREQIAQMLRRAIDVSGLKDMEVVRRAGITAPTLRRALRTGSIRVESMVRILEICGAELQIGKKTLPSVDS